MSLLVGTQTLGVRTYPVKVEMADWLRRWPGEPWSKTHQVSCSFFSLLFSFLANINRIEIETKD